MLENILRTRWVEFHYRAQAEIGIQIWDYYFELMLREELIGIGITPSKNSNEIMYSAA